MQNDEMLQNIFKILVAGRATRIYIAPPFSPGGEVGKAQ
jgi:hypothetical protein